MSWPTLGALKYNPSNPEVTRTRFIAPTDALDPFLISSAYTSIFSVFPSPVFLFFHLRIRIRKLCDLPFLLHERCHQHKQKNPAIV